MGIFYTNMSRGARLKLLQEYEYAITQEGLEQDEGQIKLVAILDKLQVELEAYASRREGIRNLLNSATAPKGLYIWGDVGRGKSFLMDLFFDSIQTGKKRRVHFHAFMQEIHQALHSMSSKDKSLDEVARQIAKKTMILCFDEFQVTNIADAMVMKRLFGALFAEGVVVVATSNTPPESLYLRGLHRDRFLPFIDVLNTHMHVFHLEGGKDYRRSLVENQRRYRHPVDKSSREFIDSMWDQLTGGAEAYVHEISLKGRTLKIPQYAHRVARFSFKDLCGVPMGQSDYLALSEEISYLILESIPALAREDHDQAHRLQTLIDVLYDQDVLLVATAEVDIDHIYTEGQGAKSFTRTASRMHEMCHV